jgi:4-carboxymuconolactone decarboxylase
MSDAYSSDDGAAGRRLAQGRKSDVLQARLAELDPGMASWADEFVFGQVWSRDGLGFEERSLVAIGVLAATDRMDMLRNYLHGALQRGVPEEKLREVLVMQVVYAGFPLAIKAVAELDAVLRAHRRHEGAASAE